MENIVNSLTSFTCEICNKKYSSKSSLCNHNKKFHNNNNVYDVNRLSIIAKYTITEIKTLCKIC